MGTANPEKTPRKHETLTGVLKIWAVLYGLGLTFVPFVLHKMIFVMPTEVIVYLCFYSVCPSFLNIWLFSGAMLVVYVGIPTVLSIIVAIILDILARRRARMHNTDIATQTE